VPAPPGRPSVDAAIGVRDHHVPVRRDPVGMERRRGETPLAQPEVPLAREESRPEDRADVFPEEAVLDELLALLPKNLVDGVGMVEEVRLVAPEAQAGDVAVFVRAEG